MRESEGSGIQKISVLKRFKSNENTFLFMGLLIYTIACAIIEPRFATPYNFSVLMEQLTVPGILAVGMCVVMISGGIDLSVGQLLSFAACTTADIIYKGGNVVLAIATGVVLCIAFELFMGFIISRTSLEPFIVSLGFMTIYQGFAYIITAGAEYPISGTMGFATNVRLFNLPLMFYVALLVFIIFAILFRYARFGRWLYAVGDNPEAAFLAGINVKNFKLKVYAINGFLVAVASVLMLSRNEVGSPALGTGLEINAIASCVVGGVAMAGGVGNIPGVLIGAIWMGIISNSLNIVGLSSFYQYVVTGGIIIIAVLINNLRLKK